MPDEIERLMILVFDGEVRTVANLWEFAEWENAASYAAEQPGLKLGMGDEVGILRNELAIIIRKMWAKNLYVEEEIAELVRGLKYQERLGLPAARDMH